MNRTNRHVWLVLMILLIAVVGCSRSETRTDTRAAETATPPAAETRVTSADLGSDIQADKHVTTPMTSFTPDQTIYLSVATDAAAPGATVTTRWLDASGKVIDETTETIAAAGPVVTEFHMAKPNLPPGKYAAEILINGAVAIRKDFEIK